MIEAALPDNERERIRKLHEVGILDTLEEQAYDDLTQLAAQICNTPIALVSLIDEDRQWFKSHHGLDARETPRAFAFCAHAILDDEVFVVEDSAQDERFFDNPLATGGPHVTFYAGAPLIMSDDIKLGTLCVISDQPRSISASQKKSLQALARQVVSQIELRLKVKELNSLDHAKDEFISMVSHELRTPLTAIYGALSLLMNTACKQLEDKPLHMMDVAYRNSERLLCLVNDILDLAKLESGKLQILKEPLDLVSLLEKACELNEQYCHKCNVMLKIESLNVSAPINVLGDEQRLLQVMSNLISNAAKFSYDAGTVKVNLTIQNDRAVVEVNDQGPGIPIDKQSLLFTKFKQLDDQMNKQMPGTGLGLNICKQIIELQDGVIGFHSVPDIKTTFYFELPLA